MNLTDNSWGEYGNFNFSPRVDSLWNLRLFFGINFNGRNLYERWTNFFFYGKILPQGIRDHF